MLWTASAKLDSRGGSYREPLQRRSITWVASARSVAEAVLKLGPAFRLAGAAPFQNHLKPLRWGVPASHFCSSGYQLNLYAECHKHDTPGPQSLA